MQRHPFRVSALSAAVFAILLAACGAGSRGDADPPAAGTSPTPAAAGSPIDGGTMVLGEPVEPQELNCVRVNDAPALRVCRLVADSLLDFDREMRVVPRLAESFETSADGRTLTFRLRGGVRWHDGKPFTSKDVLYTVDQIRAPGADVKANRAALFETLASIAAPDARTVVATYREPFAPALQAWVRTFILPAHLPFAPGERTPMDRAPIGTGPFRFARWDHQEKIVLEANKDYYAGRPHLDRLIVRYVPDARSLAIAMKTGDADLAWLPPAEAGADDPNLPYRIAKLPALTLDVILWNSREHRGLFADARVRRALTLALDRAAYISRITLGSDLPAVSSFHPLSWAHDPSLGPLPHDPRGAASLLSAAGWKDRDGDGVLDASSGPASFTLLFRSGNAEHEKLASLFQAAARPLGVEVRLQALDWPVLRDKVRGHAFEAAVFRWSLDADPDPYDFFHSSQYPSGLNYGGYANAEVDRLAEQGRRTLDVGARAAIYHRVEAIVRDEQPCTFISHPTSLAAVSRRVRGTETALAGFLSWRDAALTFWLAPPEEKAGR